MPKKWCPDCQEYMIDIDCKVDQTKKALILKWHEGPCVCGRAEKFTREVIYVRCEECGQPLRQGDDTICWKCQGILEAAAEMADTEMIFWGFQDPYAHSYILDYYFELINDGVNYGELMYFPVEAAEGA